MRICRNCGAALGDEERFCSSCGTKVEENTFNGQYQGPVSYTHLDVYKRQVP